ncbi:Cytochrome c-like domain [Pseudocohnilembus persalinus]|uniref:Cytochrome c-like domain n=1 Tax=Pseudocohnilembus persalinus TaxID=266149 RepID=A0A0V0Q962_PSEPJ|nr:Cytochrome c-like domain [Pseudocohnilembus persalinus]|eukprot:KRW98705.1 Cytochrome c-like domain [Pseudocohnilembus persalinus]
MPPKKKGIQEPKVDVPEGDPAAGRIIFDANCSACHAFSGDAKSASAPMLGGLMGRKAGSTEFAYSKAFKKAGFEWNDKFLFAFINNPGKMVPGNRMAFAGIQDEQQRADLIAYISEQ